MPMPTCSPHILRHAVLFLAFLLLPLPALANETLHCPAGDVPCLIDAILQANKRDETTLILDASVYTLQEPDPDSFFEGATAFPIITSILTIQGQGAAQTLITRDPTAPLFRLFAVAETGVLTLERLTLAGGAVRIDWGERGGGVLNFGTLRLEQAVLRNHSAWIGGAIDNVGVLESDASSISDNFGDFVAGGVAAIGPTTITRTLLSGNIAQIDAAASWDPRSLFELRQSWVNDNLATGSGAGGVGGTGSARLVETILSGNIGAVRGGALTLRGRESILALVRSTCVGNSALFLGGCLFNAGGLVRLQESQVVNNVAGLEGLAGVGGGLYNAGGVMRARNSIILGNRAFTGPDCQGELTVQGSTVVGNPSGCDITAR